MMAHAATEEEVWEMLKKDVYAKSGVWDFEKVRIWMASYKRTRIIY
jgi:hypothetical protein